MSGKKFGDNLLMTDFKSTIIVSIFAQISIMTTFQKIRGHFASNGALIWWNFGHSVKR
jgi:hypothetical protein